MLFSLFEKNYYIYIYIYGVSYILSFFAIFKCNVFSALHTKNLEIWKGILWNWRVNCFIAQFIKWCDILGAHRECNFPIIQLFFSLQYFFFVGLLLIAVSISLDTFGKPTVGFFLKIPFSSWIIFSISLMELNWSDWFLKRWWWIFLK